MNPLDPHWCTECGRRLLPVRVNGTPQVPKCTCRPNAKRMSAKFVNQRFRQIYAAIELAATTSIIR